MLQNLCVYLFGKEIGTLRHTQNGARFSFNQDVVAQRSGSPLLSTALPVQAGEFDAETTKKWFTGLLPEDDRLIETQRFYGIQDGTYLDLLREIGWECAGAVTVLPEDATHAPSERSLPITIEELAQRLRALPSHPYDTPETMRMSLGGFQEKLCVIAPDAVFSDGLATLRTLLLSEQGAPTTHILKPQPNRFPGMIRAEAWGMTVASHATETAQVALLANSAAEEIMPETLVVKRFDRTIQDGKTVRLHQEDCCQALGLDSSRKYAAEANPTKSDPTFLGIARLLASHAENPMVELERLFTQMTVNVALGNTDAHAKNYAFLHEEDSIELSPMYDVIPALEITPGILAMGMRTNGRIRIDRIEGSDLLAEGRSWDLPAKRCKALLADTLERLGEGVEAANALYPQAADRHAGPTIERIRLLAKSS